VKSRYTHITLAECEIIRKLRAREQTPAQIARVLGKHRSTIWREIKRNINGVDAYWERHAHAFMLKRRLRAKAYRQVIDNDMIMTGFMQDMLKRTYSPEQIAGYMRRSHHPRPVCHKTIYRWIHRDWRSRKGYLRFKGRPRLSYGASKTEWQPHKRHITERPRAVEKRLRVGDWEADLVHGSQDDSRHCILTLNERRTRFSIGRKLQTLRSLPVAYILADALRDLPVRTLTCDNGIEFGRHKTIEKLLKCKVYFTDTNSPQQRGANENLNGLLREFFPKGKSLAHVRQEDVTRIFTILNRRPRKVLGYDCPRNAFAELTGASYYLVR
jgi:transposase, IS30 family